MRTATAPALPDNHPFRHPRRADPAGLGFPHQARFWKSLHGAGLCLHGSGQPDDVDNPRELIASLPTHYLIEGFNFLALFCQNRYQNHND